MALIENAIAHGELAVRNTLSFWGKNDPIGALLVLT
jgi:hypothetical protein